jgi:acyl-CoA synthetase (NDP forming)
MSDATRAVDASTGRTERVIALLPFLHAPASVAVVGASDDPEKIGGRPIRYLREFGYAGRVMPVNPGRSSVQGLRAYADLGSLPDVPDVAVIAVPGQAAFESVRAAAQAGVAGCVVMASGFAETGDPAAVELQADMVAAAGAHGMRLVGPNCQGLANFSNGAVLAFSTMFTEQEPEDGPVAVVSQSGAVCAVVYGRLRQQGIGVRYAHGTGNDADVTVGELAEAVVVDPDIRLVLLYVEDIRDPAPLERAARLATERDVPIVALMGGRSAEGQRAARSHTGAIANEQRVVDAFFERLGVWRANSVSELIEAAPLYLQRWRPPGRRVALISQSGAVCVLAADAAAEQALPLAKFDGETVTELQRALPRFATKENPVDLTAALLTDSALLGKVLAAIERDSGVDACFVGMPVVGRGYDVPRLAADAAVVARGHHRPLVVAAAQPAVAAEFRRAGVVVYDDESGAMRALAQFLRHRERMTAAGTRMTRTSRTTATATGEPRTLNEAESLALLAGIGVPVVPHTLCPDPASAVHAFEDLGAARVVLKGCTSDAAHKSELGLVRLGLATRQDVERAGVDVREAMRRHGLRFDGLLVAAMTHAAREVMVGAHVDPVFGPLVLVGDGGKYVEALPDVQLLFPPFDAADVRRAIARLRIAPLLEGVRGETPSDIDAWVRVVLKVGAAMTDATTEIVSLDVNPLMLPPRGSASLDAVAVDAVAIVVPGHS